MRAYQIMDKLRKLREEHGDRPVVVEISTLWEYHHYVGAVVGVYYSKGKFVISADHEEAPGEKEEESPW